MPFQELNDEQKKQMKEPRLQQYRAQIYTLELDTLAYRAIGDHVSAQKAQENIEDLKKAYEAVESGKQWVH